MLFLLVFFVLQLRVAFAFSDDNSIQERGAVEVPLDVLQVEAPLRASYKGASCQQVVIQHEFAASYGTPYVGKYARNILCHLLRLIWLKEHIPRQRIVLLQLQSSICQSHHPE